MPHVLFIPVMKGERRMQNGSSFDFCVSKYAAKNFTLLHAEMSKQVLQILSWQIFNGRFSIDSQAFSTASTCEIYIKLIVASLVSRRRALSLFLCLKMSVSASERGN